MRFHSEGGPTVEVGIYVHVIQHPRDGLVIVVGVIVIIKRVGGTPGWRRGLGRWRTHILQGLMAFSISSWERVQHLILPPPAASRLLLAPSAWLAANNIRRYCEWRGATA